MDNEFRVELQFANDLDPPSREQLHAQIKLEGLLASIKHPYGLNQFLAPIRNVDQVNSSTSWVVWKGSTGRTGKQSNSGSRFIIQKTCVSDNQIILLVRFRGNHDDYQYQYLPRLKAGKIDIRIPDQKPVDEDRPSKKISLTLAKPPVISTLDFEHTVTESIAIPAALSRQEVRECIEKRSSKTISIDNKHVRISSDGIKTHIQLEGKSERPSRAYDSRCLESDERWDAVRDTSSQIAYDPCLILSEQESELLEKFTREEFLPARIDGSAGSGKTTLLTITLANLVASWNADRVDLFDAPLFLTYSEGLCEDAANRLKFYLIIHHGWTELDAVAIAGKVCKTFSALIDSVLDEAKASNQDDDENDKPTEWNRFLTWWYSGSSNSTYKRGGMNPADVYRAMRTYIFGYLPADLTADEEQRAEVIERWKKRKTWDITEADLLEIINLWEKYRIDNPNVETSADRTIRAIDKIVANPEKYANWGHILCDEVQDLSDHDLRLLACLTRHSAIGITDPSSGRGEDSINVMLPLILAGDEMQSINPSGFTFEGCEEVFREFASDLGYQLNSIPKPLRLTENFRSLKSIVEFGSACRQLHNSYDRNRLAPKISIYRNKENAGQITRVEFNGEPNESIKKLFSESDFKILIPCRTEEKSNYCKPGGELSKLLGIDEFRIKELLTPEECKGLEYKAVVICGFGKAYEDAIKENRTSWTLNALSVAATRGRDKIYFVDNKNHSTKLWNDLFELGKLETVPISAETIEQTIDVQVDSLETTLKDTLCDDFGSSQLKDSVEKVQSLKLKIDNLIANPELPHEYLSSLELNSKIAQGWLNYVSGPGDSAQDWLILSTPFGGKVWRRLIDDAIKKERVDALRAATDSASKLGSENVDRIFQAICICFDAERKESDEQNALLNLCVRFDRIDESGKRQVYYFKNLISESIVGKLWKSVQETVISSQFSWNPDVTEVILLHLRIFELSIPMMAVIDIRANLMNKDVAFRKLEDHKETLRTSVSLHRTLLTEILVYHYGISWLNRLTIEKDVAPTLKAGSLDKSLLFESLSHDLPRADTEENLEMVIAMATSEASEIDRQSQNAKDLARASIRSLVQHEANKLHTELKAISTAIQANHKTET